MGKLDRFKNSKSSTKIAGLPTTPMTSSSPLTRGTTTPKSGVLPLNRGTGFSIKLKLPNSKSILSNNSPKVPLVRGQSLKNSGGSLEAANQITYNPKLHSRSKAMSREMTKAEQKIWFEVLTQKKLLGYKFIKQKIIDNYIVDFYCSELLLAIEIDGNSHDEKQEYDKVRENFLRACGITVLRFTNAEVLENLEGVREELVEWVGVGQGL